MEAIIRMIKEIGNKLRMINNFLDSLKTPHDFDQVKADAIDIGRDLATFWLYVITTLRKYHNEGKSSASSRRVSELLLTAMLT
jgi:hypothetical protein